MLREELLSPFRRLYARLVEQASRTGSSYTHYWLGPLVNLRNDSMLISSETSLPHILLDLLVDSRHLSFQLRDDDGFCAPLAVLRLK